MGTSAADDAAHRNGGNKRAASTIIMLCAVAVVAVVLVHKESSVNVSEEAVGGELSEARLSHFDELMLFQDVDKDAKLVRHKHHKHLRFNNLAAELDDDEVIRIETTPAKPPPASAAKPPPAGAVLPPVDPVVDDTLPPVHASLRTGHVEQYGQDAYDSHAVDVAGNEAARVLKEGEPAATAYESAQKAATTVVVGGAAKHGEAPAFSRTIRAAAYAAEMRALKTLEAGASGEEAKKAAKDAADGMVRDERAVEMTVPVPSTLNELLGNVDHLWDKMQSNLMALNQVVGSIPLEECEATRASAVQAKAKMLGAIRSAGQHIAKGHNHQDAMEVLLLQVDQHEDRIRALLAVPTEAHEVATVQRKVRAINSKADQSKQASAIHHDGARKQAHLAEGFLALARKHHATATDAAARCKAQGVISKFAFAKQQLERYDEEVRVAALERAKKKAVEVKEKAIARENAAYAKTMKGSLSMQMTAAANKAAMAAIKSKDKVEILGVETGADVHQAQLAAENACSVTMKAAAKSLAKNMAAVAAKNGKDSSQAMKTAILSVLQAGRPLEASIVSAAVKTAADWAEVHRKQAWDATHREMPAPPVKVPAEPTVAARPPAVAVPPGAGQVVAQAQHDDAKKLVSEVAKQADKQKTAKTVNHVKEVAKPPPIKKVLEKTKAVKAEVSKKMAKEAANKHAKKDEADEKKVKKKVAKKSAKEAAVKKTASVKKAVKKVVKKAVKKTAKAAIALKSAVKKQAEKVEEAKKAAKKAAEKAKLDEENAKVAASKVDNEAEKKVANEVDHALGLKTKVKAKAVLDNVLVSTPKTHARSVQHAAQAMSAAVTKATAEAAELARKAVADHGGNLQQQLEAATMAAAAASKQAAAHEAARMRQVVKPVKAPTTARLIQTNTHAKPRMQKVFEASARKAAVAMRKQHTQPSEEKLNSVLQPVMVQEINKAASKAATKAGNVALSMGMDVPHAQAHVAAAAHQAAQGAKAQAKHLAQLAIHTVLAA